MNEGNEKTPGAGTPRANDPERTSYMSDSTNNVVQLHPGRNYVYRHFDANGVALYVGCSKDVERRFKQHLFENTWWAEKVAKTRVTVHPDRATALRVEKLEIARLEPLYTGEVYLLATAKWDREAFIERGRAAAKGTCGTTMNARGAAGQLFIAYYRKFGRDLFADMGPVAPGRRRVTGGFVEAPRECRFEGASKFFAGMEVAS